MATTTAARTHTAEAAFARQIHAVVRDLMTPRPAIYWTDFLVTVVVAYASLWFYLTSALFSPLQVVCGVVAALALYRASIFNHELSHQQAKHLPGFRAAWNLLFGVPFMMPSFLYADHKSHHVNHSYGTTGDAEYYPLAHGPAAVVYLYLAQVLILPVAAILRFVLLGPLSLVVPPLRRVVWERASSLAAINPNYRRPMPTAQEKWPWLAQEMGCFAVGAGAIGLTAAGVIPWIWWPMLYVVFVLVTTVNYIRALGAHRYLGEGDRMTYVEQMLDSTTIPGHPLLTELWAPLGMRYHALHHLVPSLPYHAMGTAHRRLMRELPEDSPYRHTLRPNLWTAVREVYHSATSAQAVT